MRSTTFARSATQAQAGMRTITIHALHAAIPQRLAAGMLALRVVADAGGPLDAGIARINPGATMSEVQAANDQGDFMRLTQLVTFVGGVGVPSRSMGTVVVDLRIPGQYGLHVQRGDQDPGSATLFTVTAAGTQAATMPPADVAVTLRGTRFVGLPKTLHAGTTTFKVSNRASGVRDMLLYRVDPGKTLRDMIAAMKADERTGKDPAWAHAAASIDVLSPRQTARVTVHLTPGSYFALCPLPDPQHGGEALAFEGMIVPFTVS